MVEQKHILEKLQRLQNQPMNKERARQFVELISAGGAGETTPPEWGALIIDLWIQARPLLRENVKQDD